MSPDLPALCYMISADGTDMPSCWACIDTSNKLSYYAEEFLMRITVDQQLPFHVNPLTATGRAAVIDGEVQFSSSNESVVTIEKTGPYSGLIKPAGKVGVVQIRAQFDADLGDGVREVSTSAALEVVAAEATSAVIEFGEPTNEEPSPPPVEELPPPTEEPTPSPEPEIDPWERPLTLQNVPEGTTVPKLVIGKSKVNVRDHGAKGNGKDNDTAAFVAAVKALPADGGTLILPDGEYMLEASEKTWLRSNLRIFWHDNAWLNAIPHDDDRAYVLTVLDLQHVELYNPQVRGERLKHTFTTFPPITQSDGTTKPSSRDTHEWGHNIAVRGKTTDVNILLGETREANGDGLSCGGSKLFIYGLKADANRRQGITMGSAKDSKVYNCDLQNTGTYLTSKGTQPQAGIDIEPDAPNDSRNVHVYGCRMRGNRVGIEVYGNATPINDDYAEILGFLAENNDIGENIIGISLTGVKGPVIRGNYIHDNETLGVQTVARVDGLVLDNNTYKNNSTRLGTQAPRNFDLAGTSTKTTRDILLKGSPTNVQYPTESHFR